MKLALVGRDVSRSLSGEMHTFILNEWGIPCQYENVSTEADAFDKHVVRLLGTVDGFNVTVPYKLDVKRHLAEFVDSADSFGAVNTVVCAGKRGYNTDGIGFLRMLEYAEIEVKERSVLVLGAGGAARAVIATLIHAGAIVTVHNRTTKRAYELQKELGGFAVSEDGLGKYDVVVNTTSAGMGAQIGVLPCALQTAQQAGALVDIVYRPSKTAFLQVADGTGARTVNGLAMLFFQAYYADCIYLDKTPDQAEAFDFYDKYLAQRSV